MLIENVDLNYQHCIYIYISSSSKLSINSDAVWNCKYSYQIETKIKVFDIQICSINVKNDSFVDSKPVLLIFYSACDSPVGLEWDLWFGISNKLMLMLLILDLFFEWQDLNDHFIVNVLLAMMAKVQTLNLSSACLC